MRRNKIRLTESKLRQIVKETVKRVLKETPLDYDEDNFSGRHYKTPPSPEEWTDNDGYLDDPEKKNDIEYDMYEDPYYEQFDSLKDAENDYSWDLFDRKGRYPGVNTGGYYATKGAEDSETDDAIKLHNARRDWSPDELRDRDRDMKYYLGATSAE